jgi:hypothetical protein
VLVSDRGCRRPATIGRLGIRRPGSAAYSYVSYRARACWVRVGAFEPGGAGARPAGR